MHASIRALACTGLAALAVASVSLEAQARPHGRGGHHAMPASGGHGGGGHGGGWHRGGHVWGTAPLHAAPQHRWHRPVLGIGIGLGLGFAAHAHSGHLHFGTAYPGAVHPGYLLVPAYPRVHGYGHPGVVITMPGPPMHIPPEPPEPAAPSPPEPVIYPNRQQTPQQTELDRRECDRWAFSQPQALADASVFHRATTACLEGRGYTVR